MTPPIYSHENTIKTTLLHLNEGSKMYSLFVHAHTTITYTLLFTTVYSALLCYVCDLLCYLAIN